MWQEVIKENKTAVSTFLFLLCLFPLLGSAEPGNKPLSADASALELRLVETHMEGTIPSAIIERRADKQRAEFKLDEPIFSSDTRLARVGEKVVLIEHGGQLEFLAQETELK